MRSDIDVHHEAMSGLLLCSDGLHGMVSDERMKAILTGNEPEKAADLLLEAALEAGGRDNISLVIFLDGEADK